MATACLRRSGSRLREAPASAGVGRSRRQAVRGEAFGLPFVLRLSKDERFTQDRLVARCARREARREP